MSELSHTPEEPSTAYLDAASRAIHEKMAQVEPPEVSSSDYQQQPALWDAVRAAEKELRAELADLAADLHAHPETAFTEHRSAGVIAEILERHGFSVERGAHGVQTALRSEWASADYDQSQHPTIAVMSEYDALPGIGHACGHNIIAASGLGAFLAAVRALRSHAVSGRVVFLGTPAEEGHSGKEYMIRGGMLEGIDAAMMIHPFSYDIANHAWVGRRALKVKFSGVAAHASSQPFMGRNALDAATLAYQGMGLLRQQMPPSDRLHAVITEGGVRPSVIPDEAQMDIYVRSALVDTLMDLSSRIADICHGAALMAGVGVELEWDEHPMTLPVRTNEALAQRWTRTQSACGRTALPAGIVPDTLAASTDFGNVSYLVPGIHPMVAISPEDVALHTEDFARWAHSDSARAGLSDSVVGLAQVICDALCDPHLLAAAKAEFERAGGKRRVVDLVD
ncbi:M20 family metallopeptidase [Corynebacterium tapiri]|uniref:Peptidase M20 domain-containing protein 2 n=1 Tax=Corynebacterium tapiri TaxID=1448266 RepID=A0A5C4U2T2_9CORY|nr:M20 family metallopeptidase [Corynebacterium tapiri]TNL95710.1 M20 family metallopeptidase [Corynebacterium tapiri]